MLSLKINDIKSFMNQLLLTDTFDHLETAEVIITTFNTFSINGKIKKEFFDNPRDVSSEEEPSEYSLWKELRPYCYQVIRGKRTPVSFKIILQLSSKEKQALLQKGDLSADSTESGGFYLNIQYKNQTLFCTTGIGFQTFLLNSPLKELWDLTILDFFRSRKIPFEQM